MVGLSSIVKYVGVFWLGAMFGLLAMGLLVAASSGEDE